MGEKRKFWNREGFEKSPNKEKEQILTEAVCPAAVLQNQQPDRDITWQRLAGSRNSNAFCEEAHSFLSHLPHAEKWKKHKDG